jgi:hypothetical protein
MWYKDIGEPDVDDGERVPFDDWRRQYAGVVVDIGGEPESGADVVQK